jgi:eukaryotic-like serine/threonine-protein kinase
LSRLNPPILARDPSEDSPAPETIALSARRLGIAAVIGAVVYVVYLVLDRTVWADVGNAIGMLMVLVGLFASVATAAYVLTGTRPASRVIVVGVSYEALLALSMAVSEALLTAYREPSPQVSWSAVVIVLFPFLIPARPAVVLGASVLAAAMTPLGMALVFGFTAKSWPPLEILASYLIPPFACAVLAWAPTRALAQMLVVVQKARRLGNYELTERLGAGGMGEVWLAKHRLLARPAAVKLIKPEVLGAKDAESRDSVLRRFEREAQVTANLNSPHTVELYDFGVSPDGVLFYVMELLHGVDLDTLVSRFGPLPSERVIHFLMQACDSLDDAHRRGLIHRDIKPANLFVSRRGSSVDFLKVLDFGLVKRSGGIPEQSSDSLGDSVLHTKQTGEGQIMGTPAFMPPEAILGNQAVDQRADIYALGCVGYWMLTGQLAFDEGTIVGMLTAHLTSQPISPSKRLGAPIVADLERVVLDCLQKDRDARPASADALRSALDRIPLPEPWSRERANAWWAEHMPARSKPAPAPQSTSP